MTDYREPGVLQETFRFFQNFYRFAFTDLKMILAMNITSRCNLRCAHCYWWREEHPPELDDEQMIAFMQQQRKAGKNLAILYGGEPTLRPNVCREATRIFDATIIFTNGTVGFPDIPAIWMLSLEGTREVNDAIRGKGVYDKVMKNLQRDTYRKPIVHITITRQNQHDIEPFLQEMSAHSHLIRGIGFSFYTPEIGKDESDIFIPLPERDRVLDELLLLSKRYWRIMGFNEPLAHQFRSTGAFPEWNSLQTCTVTEMVDCFNSDGSPISCIYGNNADCSRCGCTGVAVYRAAFKKFNPLSLFNALGIIIARNRK
jgi:sulfatase maturation enzyme AslB (radical SAM superfamily)